MKKNVRKLISSMFPFGSGLLKEFEEETISDLSTGNPVLLFSQHNTA
jgi:hypothetical protein